jgi:hypothetical protein
MMVSCNRVHKPLQPLLSGAGCISTTTVSDMAQPEARLQQTAVVVRHHFISTRVTKMVADTAAAQ